MKTKELRELQARLQKELLKQKEVQIDSSFKQFLIDKYGSVKKAAEYAEVDDSQLYRYLKNGKFPHSSAKYYYRLIE